MLVLDDSVDCSLRVKERVDGINCSVVVVREEVDSVDSSEVVVEVWLVMDDCSVVTEDIFALVDVVLGNMLQLLAIVVYSATVND